MAYKKGMLTFIYLRMRYSLHIVLDDDQTRVTTIDLYLGKRLISRGPHVRGTRQIVTGMAHAPNWRKTEIFNTTSIIPPVSQWCVFPRVSCSRTYIPRDACSPHTALPEIVIFQNFEIH